MLPSVMGLLGVSSPVAVACLVVALVVWRRHRRALAAETKLPNGMTINHLRKTETDLLYNEIFGGDCYRLPEGDLDAANMSIQLQPGDVVVDVGANIGMFALWAAWHEQVAGKVRVLSYECVPSTHAVLAKNAKRHTQGECQLEAFAYGLSDAERTATIYHHPNFSIWSTSKRDMDGARDAMLRENLPHLANRASADRGAALRWLPTGLFHSLVCWGGGRIIGALNKVEAVSCRFRRLSDAVFVEGGVERVALLKVDVEGAELDVLKGIDADHWRCIEQVAMEVENDDLAAQVTNLLQAQGFRVRTWRSGDMERLLPTSQVKQLLAKRADLVAGRATAGGGTKGAIGRRATSPARRGRTN